MQLDELIEKQTAESIAKKTNITVEVISRLQNRDFATLKKTQALGAISILEREYNIDLSPLRQECKTYFEDKDVLKEGVTALKPIAGDKRTYSRILSLLLLILLASGAWYFFTEYYEKKVEPIGKDHGKTVAETESKEVKSKEPESSISQTGEENLSTGSASGEGTLKIADVADIETASQKSEAVTQPESNEENRSAEATPPAPAVEEPGRAEASLEESLKEDLSELEEMAKSLEIEKNDSMIAPKEGVAIAEAERIEIEKREPAAESIVAEQNDSGTVSSENAAPEQDETTAENTPIIVRESIMLLPEKRMWFRLTNLNTGKSRQFKRKDRYEIDLRENGWLFATENARFSIIDGEMLEEYSGKGKLFFRFDQNGVRQLSEEEYRAAQK